MLLSFKCEADFHCHLPMSNLAVIDVTSHIGNLEPAHVSDSATCMSHSMTYGILNACTGCTRELDMLVDMVSHATILFLVE
jgi:hypothetical protein